MANSAKTAIKVEGTSMNELVKEGKALGRIWATVNSLKATTKANGFDTRLGKLLSVLKAQSSSDNGQIPTHVLRTHGIDKIDRRRRSEALWFYENQADCLEFIKNSKKGFSSLTALQAAMRKAAKANVPTEQPSNVGQSDAKQAKLVEQSKQTMSVGPITRTKMVATILKQCEINGLNVEDIINDLQSQLAKAS
jgi:hypothetical protein